MANLAGYINAMVSRLNVAITAMKLSLAVLAVSQLHAAESAAWRSWRRLPSMASSRRRWLQPGGWRRKSQLLASAGTSSSQPQLHYQAGSEKEASVGSPLPGCQPPARKLHQLQPSLLTSAVAISGWLLPSLMAVRQRWRRSRTASQRCAGYGAGSSARGWRLKISASSKQSTLQQRPHHQPGAANRRGSQRRQPGVPLARLARRSAGGAITPPRSGRSAAISGRNKLMQCSLWPNDLANRPKPIQIEVI